VTKLRHNVGIKSYSVTLAFALLALTACGQLDASAVMQQATNLKSTVAEGALLADGAAHNRYTARFTQVRADEIGDDAAQLVNSLQDSQVAPAAREEESGPEATALLVGWPGLLTRLGLKRSVADRARISWGQAAHLPKSGSW
jgi:hypothetical protein